MPHPPTTAAQAEHTETLRQITLGHCHDGGTGITNFPKEQAPIYREAIRLHGDPSLVVSESDFMDGDPSQFSLHDLTNADERKGDLSPFWDVFDLVRALYKTHRLYGVEHTGAANWVRYRNQLTATQARLAALEEALKRATDALGDCTRQFRGHNMIASYDVAKVYWLEAKKELAALAKS